MYTVVPIRRIVRCPGSCFLLVFIVFIIYWVSYSFELKQTNSDLNDDSYDEEKFHFKYHRARGLEQSLVHSTTKLNKVVKDKTSEEQQPVGQFDTNLQNFDYEKDAEYAPMKHILVHLDLKGAAPKVEYLKSFFPLIKSFGATGVLIEYEDTFPYWGKLEFLSARNGYSKRDIAEILDSIHDNGLEIIPLIQTFGHMEFVLKLEDFQHLREVPTYPDAVCPSHNGTLPLIISMVDQIMELHSGINWLHIGCDEVYSLGECTRCQENILKNNWTKNDLFLHHAVSVAKYIKESYDVQPIMWDDEFRKVPFEALRKSGIGGYADIMVWRYSPGLMLELRNDMWEKYAKIFSGVWVASAFKGSTRPESFITSINYHLDNQKEWMEVTDFYKDTINFHGIALTGWQRFDHFGALCELLPQAIPSLAVCLTYILNRRMDHQALLKVGEHLKCNSYLTLDLKYLESENICNFPGSEVYKISQTLYILKKDIEDMFKNDHVTGWLTQFNIRNEFVSHRHIEQGLQGLSVILKEYKTLRNDSYHCLSEVYDIYTVNEWIETNIDLLYEKLMTIDKESSALLKKKTWSRRPVGEPSVKEL